nr:hypothetical protein [uncultured Flavobacterium sp.]
MARRHSTGETPEEIDRLMQIIELNYGGEWLKTNNLHPISQLWSRADEMATHELMFLATAIDTLQAIDERWTKEQIKISKSQQVNNSRGAIFELMALSAMHSEKHPVSPAELNQAGFDGTITHPHNPKLRVSIKNYGTSNSQKTFLKKAKLAEEMIVKLLKKYNYPPTQIYIDFGDHFPEERDWVTFHKSADKFFALKRKDADPFCGVVEKSKDDPSKDALTFSMLISPLNGDFHSGYNSYTLMISGLYHKNERKNLYSKLEEACTNLQKHSAVENEQIINTLFIRLPDTVSVDSCQQWLDDYFEMFPAKPISIVFLYQPTIITQNASSLISHCVRIYLKNEIDVQRKIKGKMTFQFPVGIITENTAQEFLLAELPDGSSEKIDIQDRYFYQRGELYQKLKSNEDGTFGGNVSRPANGIFLNLVLEIPGQKQSAVIKGKFAESDNLIII